MSSFEEVVELVVASVVSTVVVCNTVVAMFSEYCGFRVEPVDVVYRRDGNIVRTMTTPVLAPRSMSASLAEIRGVVGLSESELPAADACALAEKMQLSPATYDAATDTLTVAVPVTRSDIMHAVDVGQQQKRQQHGAHRQPGIMRRMVAVVVGRRNLLRRSSRHDCVQSGLPPAHHRPAVPSRWAAAAAELAPAASSVGHSEASQTGGV